MGRLTLDARPRGPEDRGITMASIERSIEYSLADQTVRGAGSYEEACARHVWKIPSCYNIALDICDRHAGDAGCHALVWESPEGPGETYTFDDLKSGKIRRAELRARAGATGEHS
jgi:hypothetical protein